MEQRSGRLIRQGNTNAEVEIYRYVTEETFDSYLWQLVENKQRFISQIMTSKSPVRAAEDIDETALSFAEIKMLATGNPHIKEKIDLDIQVSRLKLLKQSHLHEKYAMEDKLYKQFPKEVLYLEERIRGYEADIVTVSNHVPDGKEKFLPMYIGDRTFYEKAEAGAAILEACREKNQPEPTSLGSYRGFSMDLAFENREYVVILKGAISHRVTLGSDIHGNFTRIDNVLDGIGTRLDAAKLQLENTKVQMENARSDIEKPFPQEEELQNKSARLDEINILLNMDKRDNEIVDGDLDEQENEGEARDVGLVR